MGQVHDLLMRRVAEGAERVAFVHGRTDRAITWDELARQASAWSSQLVPGTRSGASMTGLALRSPIGFCGAYLAGLASGTAVAPLDPRATADELAERTRVLALTDVVGDELDSVQVEAVALAGARVWHLGAKGPELVSGVAERWDPSKRAAPSVILATSGSTGRPKLVPLTEDQLVQVAAQVAVHHGLGPSDRGYCPLPLFHINAQVVGILSTLVCGGSLVVEERFARDGFWDIAEANAATWLNLVPAILAAVTPGDSGVVPGHCVRFARSASSPLPEAVRARFEAACGIAVLETYGMTEAASQITANPLRAEYRRAGSVGLPVGVDLRVVGPDGAAAGPGETGEVRIRGRGVIDRYLLPGRIDWISARDEEGWLPTGDLGRRDADGYLFLVGRVDDVINRGGEKVYPREIEEVLLRDDRVHGAVAVGRAHPSLGAQPVAFVAAAVSAEKRDRLAAELGHACELALSRYKRPVEIFVTDELPVGATGKVARRRLAETLEVPVFETIGGKR